MRKYTFEGWLAKLKPGDTDWHNPCPMIREIPKKFRRHTRCSCAYTRSIAISIRLGMVFCTNCGEIIAVYEPPRITV